MEPPTRRVSKACDACKMRKVKCNGRERCQQCSHLGLKCIYSASATKRTQGKRGRIILEYKSKTSKPNVTSPPILVANIGQTEFPSPPSVPAEQNGGELSLFSFDQTSLDSGGSSGLRLTFKKVQTQAPMSALSKYDQNFFLDLIPGYLEMVYPVHPVITEKELKAHIHAMETDQESLSFIYAFGGITLNLTRFGDKRTDEVDRDIETLINHSIQTLKPPYATFHSSVMRAVQSGFLHNCLVSMQASDAAFYYMRDSISAIQLLRIDSPENMATLPPHERSRRQRLYWQAFIHERFVAIIDYRHAILPPLDSLPENDPTIPISIHEGFNQIIKLFQLLDQEFLRNWLGSQGKGNVTCDWVEAKSKELEGEEESESQGLALLSNMQRADLAITREWLRTIVWRMAMSQTLLSSRSSKECFSLLFPVRLSQSLRQQVTSLSREDIEVHGTSIVQKLFEITDTIADVLIHVPAATLEETACRTEDFVFILDFVLLFPALDQTRRGILLEKLERLQSMFPEIRSATSSPNVPSLLDIQSPTIDPWSNVVQSQIAPDTSTDIIIPEILAPIQENDVPQPINRVTQKAAWNHISRRLSMATFSNS